MLSKLRTLSDRNTELEITENTKLSNSAVDSLKQPRLTTTKSLDKLKKVEGQEMMLSDRDSFIKNKSSRLQLIAAIEQE